MRLSSKCGHSATILAWNPPTTPPDRVHRSHESVDLRWAYRAFEWAGGGVCLSQLQVLAVISHGLFSRNPRIASPVSGFDFEEILRFICCIMMNSNKFRSGKLRGDPWAVLFSEILPLGALHHILQSIRSLKLLPYPVSVLCQGEFYEN